MRVKTFFISKLWLPSHYVSFTPGAHVHFGTLEFLVLEENQLELVKSVPPVSSADPNTVITTPEGPQPDALETQTPDSVPTPAFDYRRLERLLSTFMQPRPSPEDLRHLFFSYANIMEQLNGRETLPLGSILGSTPMAYPFGLRNAAAIADE